MRSKAIQIYEVKIMKMKNPMLVVKDIDHSVEFYKKIFGLMLLWILGQTRL